MIKHLIALLVALAVLPAHAQTGTQKTAAQLTSEINTTCPDNTVMTCTPLIFRQIVLDLVASSLPSLTAWNVMANPTGSSAGPISASITVMLDGAFGGACANNTVAARVAGVWGCQSVSSAMIGTNVIGLSNLFQPAANTTLCNPTGGAANWQACTPGQMSANLCVPNVQVFTSGAGATYTTPTCNGVAALYIEVDLVGGGGGGAGAGTGGANGTAGNNTTFSTLTGSGGALGTAGNNVLGGAGGAASGGDDNIPGGAGGPAAFASIVWSGANGGASCYGGNGGGGSGGGGNGIAGATNSGAGGGAGSTNAVVATASAGGAGGCVRKLITPTAATYTYTVGASAGGGAGGTSGSNGGAGAAGRIRVIARWQ